MTNNANGIASSQITPAKMTQNDEQSEQVTILTTQASGQNLSRPIQFPAGAVVASTMQTEGPTRLFKETLRESSKTGHPESPTEIEQPNRLFIQPAATGSSKIGAPFTPLGGDAGPLKKFDVSALKTIYQEMMRAFSQESRKDVGAELNKPIIYKLSNE
jgi:hypothetical protein